VLRDSFIQRTPERHSCHEMNNSAGMDNTALMIKGWG
jgi:hypothetical protein